MLLLNMADVEDVLLHQNLAEQPKNLSRLVLGLFVPVPLILDDEPFSENNERSRQPFRGRRRLADWRGVGADRRLLVNRWLRIMRRRGGMLFALVGTGVARAGGRTAREGACRLVGESGVLFEGGGRRSRRFPCARRRSVARSENSPRTWRDTSGLAPARD